MTACASYKNDEVLTESGLSNSRFQTEINGEKTDLFVLKNKNKMEVCITNYGGRIVSVMVPYKDGKMTSYIIDSSTVLETEYTNEGTLFSIECSKEDYVKYQSYII